MTVTMVVVVIMMATMVVMVVVVAAVITISGAMIPFARTNEFLFCLPRVAPL